MRFGTAVLALLFLAGLATAGAVVWRARTRSREWRKLVHYGSWRGCLPLDQVEEFRQLAHRRVQDEAERSEFLRMAVYGPPGPDRRMFLAFRDPARPDEIRLHLFDEAHRRLGLFVLQGGRSRGTLAWEGRGELSEEGDASFVLEESEDEYHYYAMIDDQPALVRLRSIPGDLKPNNYADPLLRVGPPLAEDALGRCESMLSSDRRDVVLQALTWLQGRHPEGSGWAELRRRPSVDRKIAALAESGNHWISEAAQALLPKEAARDR